MEEFEKLPEGQYPLLISLNKETKLVMKGMRLY